MVERAVETSGVVEPVAAVMVAAVTAVAAWEVVATAEEVLVEVATGPAVKAVVPAAAVKWVVVGQAAGGSVAAALVVVGLEEAVRVAV